MINVSLTTEQFKEILRESDTFRKAIAGKFHTKSDEQAVKPSELQRNEISILNDLREHILDFYGAGEKQLAINYVRGWIYDNSALLSASTKLSLRSLRGATEFVESVKLW